MAIYVRSILPPRAVFSYYSILFRKIKAREKIFRNAAVELDGTLHLIKILPRADPARGRKTMTNSDFCEQNKRLDVAQDYKRSQKRPFSKGKTINVGLSNM